MFFDVHNRRLLWLKILRKSPFRKRCLSTPPEKSTELASRRWLQITFILADSDRSSLHLTVRHGMSLTNNVEMMWMTHNIGMSQSSMNNLGVLLAG